MHQKSDGETSFDGCGWQPKMATWYKQLENEIARLVSVCLFIYTIECRCRIVNKCYKFYSMPFVFRCLVVHYSILTTLNPCDNYVLSVVSQSLQCIKPVQFMWTKYTAKDV